MKCYRFDLIGLFKKNWCNMKIYKIVLHRYNLSTCALITNLWSFSGYGQQEHSWSRLCYLQTQKALKTCVWVMVEVERSALSPVTLQRFSGNNDIVWGNSEDYLTTFTIKQFSHSKLPLSQGLACFDVETVQKWRK